MFVWKPWSSSQLKFCFHRSWIMIFSLTVMGSTYPRGSTILTRSWSSPSRLNLCIFYFRSRLTLCKCVVVSAFNQLSWRTRTDSTVQEVSSSRLIAVDKQLELLSAFILIFSFSVDSGNETISYVFLVLWNEPNVVSSWSSFPIVFSSSLCFIAWVIKVLCDPVYRTRCELDDIVNPLHLSLWWRIASGHNL